MAAARRLGWLQRVLAPVPTVVRGRAVRLRAVLVATLESCVAIVPRGTIRCAIDLDGLPEAPALAVELRLPTRRRECGPPPCLADALARLGAEWESRASAEALAVRVRVPLLVRDDATFAVPFCERR